MKRWQAGAKRRTDSRKARNRVLNMRMTMSLDEISDSTGLPRHYIRRMMHEDGDMLPRTIKAIMQAPVPDHPVAVHGTRWIVPAVAARRRLQGLAILGYSIKMLSQDTGVGQICLAEIRKGDRENTTARIDALIRDAADRLQMTPVEHSPRVQAAINRRVLDGWAPLMAWDDDTIGDPAARPQGRRRRR